MMNDSIGISVAQAILQSEGQARLSTSSQRLDDAFVNTPNGSKTGIVKRGGIPCGTVGEIVGPPGIGKTTVALQVAVNTIKKGHSVIWIDTSSLFPQPRLHAFLSGAVPLAEVEPCLSRINSLSIRSLPSLLVLLLHSAHTDTSIFANTPDLALLVIDDLSTPILATYPTGFEDEHARAKSNRKDFANDFTSVKRTNVLKELGNKLAALAVKRNIAILVLNQLTTKIVIGNNAVLVPALGDAWTSVCSFRMTLYRQRISPDYCNRAQDVRFAYFQKCEGIVVKDDEAKNVPFLITDNGIQDVVFPEDPTQRKHELPEDEGESQVKRRRVLSVTEYVIDDSEGEDVDFLLTGMANEPIQNEVEPDE